jgi:hypothetical protein
LLFFRDGISYYVHGESFHTFADQPMKILNHSRHPELLRKSKFRGWTPTNINQLFTIILSNRLKILLLEYFEHFNSFMFSTQETSIIVFDLVI